MSATDCEMNCAPLMKTLTIACLLALPVCAGAQVTETKLLESKAAETKAAEATEASVERTRPISKPLKYALPPIDPKQVEPPSPLLARKPRHVAEVVKAVLPVWDQSAAAHI